MGVCFACESRNPITCPRRDTSPTRAARLAGHPIKGKSSPTLKSKRRPTERRAKAHSLVNQLARWHEIRD